MLCLDPPTAPLLSPRIQGKVDKELVLEVLHENLVPPQPIEGPKVTTNQPLDAWSCVAPPWSPVGWPHGWNWDLPPV